jgi:hypothetical protein
MSVLPVLLGFCTLLVLGLYCLMPSSCMAWRFGAAAAAASIAQHVVLGMVSPLAGSLHVQLPRCIHLTTLELVCCLSVCLQELLVSPAGHAYQHCLVATFIT